MSSPGPESEAEPDSGVGVHTWWQLLRTPSCQWSQNQHPRLRTFKRSSTQVLKLLELQPEQRIEAKLTLKANNTIKICTQSTISYACVMKSKRQSGRSEYDLYDGTLHFRMFIKQVEMDGAHMPLSVRAIIKENHPRTA
jgi:hypothetical protein